MIKSIAALAAGLVTWAVVATLGNLLARAALPGYADVEAAMNFTTVMLIARLLVGGFASIAAGFVTAWIAAGARRDALILSALLLALFAPVHYSLWTRFPIWYHAAFLLSLVVLPVIGASGRRSRSGRDRRGHPA
jgi:hypothetical protein